MSLVRSARARAIAVVCSVTLGSAAAAEIPDCKSARWVAVDDADAALAERSMEIIALANNGDVERLAPLVAPSAEFTVWEGDAGIGREKGPAGAIEFAKRVGATTYAYATVFPGPISTDICAIQQVTVWLTGHDAKRAYIGKFEFEKGRLTGAVANLGAVAKGEIKVR